MDAPLHSLTLVSAALTLVLLGRRAARRSFGAGPAFGLWSLPLFAALLPWLPSLPAHGLAVPALSGSVAYAAGIVDHAPATPWLRWLWLLGTALMSLRLGLHYWRLHRQLRPLSASILAALRGTLTAQALARLRLHPAGPAVLWAPRSLVLLPVDFLQRFEAAERDLVLRHEFIHLRHGDALWSLVAELALALLWFHPLAWLARSRFRLDQELACDERVLRDAPHAAAPYAHTLLHSVGLATQPALIPWLTEPQLKERLTMIQRHRPGALRRRAGSVALAVLIAGSVFVAQAATSSHKAGQDLSYNARIQPRYPLSAIKNKEQGTVILKVLVGTDGMPLKVDVDPVTKAAPDLVEAARQAATHWHFGPEIKNGKPVEGYARVPVTFSLNEIPDKIDKDDVEKQSSKYKKID